MYSEQAYRDYAEQFLLFCAGNDPLKGRVEKEPVYQLICEGRDWDYNLHIPDVKFSSCGELIHCYLFRMGIRSDFINRTENKGWKSGVNIVRLDATLPDSAHGGPRIVGAVNSQYKKGDVLVIWNTGLDAHTFSVIDHSNGILTSVDGGQPGIRKCIRNLPNSSVLGTKLIHVWIPLMDLLEWADKRGELVEPDIQDWFTKCLTPPLWLGLSGDEVKKWQQKIKSPNPTGSFDVSTETLTKVIQKNNGLSPTGKVGIKEWTLNI